MRTTFIETLTSIADDDDRIALVVGDLGFGVVETFERAHPDRYVNVGVAEQDMIGVATGMALAGAKPFTYSIVNFSVMRCLEQIRNDVCYHNADVTMVAVGGGLAYGALGVTHHGTEDLAVLRAMPGLRVLVPADPIEARWAVETAASEPGPFFIRLNRNGEPTLHSDPPPFELGRAAVLREGTDATMIVCGAITSRALEAAELLAADGVSLRVLSHHTISEVDTGAIDRALSETRALLTLEEHSIRGGLGGAVAEVVAEHGSRTPFRRLGLPPAFVSTVGSQDHLLAGFGLTAAAIANDVRSMLESGPSS